MRQLKWLIVLMAGLLLLSWQPNVAHSQASSAATNYIVVTLDQLTVTGPQTLAIQPIRLMLGAVSASGSRVQKILWPAQIWADGAIGTPFMPDDRSAIPLFALPEDQLGDELGFGVIALDNKISVDQHPENWLNNALPAVIEAATDPMALWVTGQPTSPDDEASQITQAIAPLLGGNTRLGVIAGKFAKSSDWGVSAQTYEATAGNLNVKYRIRRVSVPANVSSTVRLKGITVQKTGRSGSDPAQLFVWALGASGFAGESLNGLVRHLPFADFYALKAGQSQTLDEVLYSGDLGAFLYTELGVWDQQASGPVSMGSLSDLWTAEELAQAPPGSLSVTIQGPNGAQVKLDLSIQLSGLTPPEVLTVDSQSLQFNGQVGQLNPTSQALRITNTGGGRLNWTATTDSPWLSVSPTSGTAPSTVSVSVNIANLSVGSFSGRITISAPGAANNPQTILVALALAAQPQAVLQVSQTTLNFQAQVGQPNPSSQSFNITNAGGGELNWTAITDSPWVSVNPTRGTSPATVNVSVNIANLSGGSFQGRITISAPGAQGSPAVVIVALALQGLPTSPCNTEFSGSTLDPAFTAYVPKPGPAFSLTDNPGHLRMELPANITTGSTTFDHWTNVDEAPQLRCSAPTGNWEMTTRLNVLSPRDQEDYHVGLMVVFSRFDLFYWGIYRGAEIRMEGSGSRPGISVILTNANAAVELMIAKEGNTYSFSCRFVSMNNWTEVGRLTRAESPTFVGLIGKTWSPTYLVSDFDYLRVTER
jgi:hypothetical protein